MTTEGATVVWWVSCLWGLVGAGAVEALALYRAIHRVRTYPWRLAGEVPLGPYLASVLIRISLGAGGATAFAVSDQVSGPLGAIAVGVTAPKLIEYLLRYGAPTEDPGAAPPVPFPPAPPVRYAPPGPLPSPSASEPEPTVTEPPEPAGPSSVPPPGYTPPGYGTPPVSGAPQGWTAPAPHEGFEPAQQTGRDLASADRRAPVSGRVPGARRSAARPLRELRAAVARSTPAYGPPAALPHRRSADD